MSKIIDAIEELQNVLALTPASDTDIEDIERKLNLRLADDYKEYLKNYGAILADNIELTGFAKAESRDVISVTKREWASNEKIEHDKYVVENTAIEGIIIWQDESRNIYESSPGKNAVLIAVDLAEYLGTIDSV